MTVLYDNKCSTCGKEVKSEIQWDVCLSCRNRKERRSVQRNGHTPLIGKSTVSRVGPSRERSESTGNELYDLYRRMIDRKSWKCISCDTQKVGIQIADVYEFSGVPGLKAICRSCSPKLGDRDVYQLAVFGTSDSSALYWMLGPQEPKNPEADPPIVIEEERVAVDKERFEVFQKAENRRHLARIRREGRYDR